MRDRAAARFSESLRRPLSHLSFVPLECPNHELSHLSGWRSSSRQFTQAVKYVSSVSLRRK